MPIFSLTINWQLTIFCFSRWNNHNHTFSQDGRLMKNDQILYVNGQNLTGKSNQEALDILRKAISSANDDSDSKIRLVVARTISGAAGSGPMEYHLSQLSPYYDRSGGMFPVPPSGAGPHPHMMG